MVKSFHSHVDDHMSAEVMCSLSTKVGARSCHTLTLYPSRLAIRRMEASPRKLAPPVPKEAKAKMTMFMTSAQLVHWIRCQFQSHFPCPKWGNSFHASTPVS